MDGENRVKLNNNKCADTQKNTDFGPSGAKCRAGVCLTERLTVFRKGTRIPAQAYTRRYNI